MVMAEVSALSSCLSHPIMIHRVESGSEKAGRDRREEYDCTTFAVAFYQVYEHMQNATS